MITAYNTLASYLRARFGDTERGASLVEYALLVALIAVVCIVAVTFLGNNAATSSTRSAAPSAADPSAAQGRGRVLRGRPLFVPDTRTVASGGA